MGSIRLKTWYLGPPFIGMDYTPDIAQILKVMLMVFPLAFLTLPKFFRHCSGNAQALLMVWQVRGSMKLRRLLYTSVMTYTGDQGDWH